MSRVCHSVGDPLSGAGALSELPQSQIARARHADSADRADACSIGPPTSSEAWAVVQVIGAILGTPMAGSGSSDHPRRVRSSLSVLLVISVACAAKFMSPRLVTVA